MRASRELMQVTTRGCIMLERPDLLRELVLKHSAKDATARQTALAELEAMQPRPSQFNPGQEIPEKNWLVRFVKKHWFNDFGVYHLQEPSADSDQPSAEEELIAESRPS